MPADYRARLEAWKVRSPVVKFNAALSAEKDPHGAYVERAVALLERALYSASS
jgi:hypothetical protein